MPVGFRIASAWVDIRAEDKGLRQQIKDAVEKATKGQDAKINLKIDSKGLRREVENALKEATKGQKPQVSIGIKAVGLRREVSDALKKATEKQKPTVKLGINAAGLRGEVQRALTKATKDQKPTVKLGISSVGLRGEVQRALTAATAGQDGHVTIHADLDSDRLRRTLTQVGDGANINPNFDVRGMRQALRAALRQISVNDDVHINPNIDGDLLRRQIQSEIGRLRDRFRVRINPDVDTDTFAARISAAARQVAGRNEDIPVDLNPRINRLRLRAETAAAMRSIAGTVPAHVDFNAIRMRAQLRASLRLAAAGAHINIPVRFDRNNWEMLRRSIGSIEEGFRAIEGPTGRYAHIIMGIAASIGPAFSLADNLIRSTGASLAFAVPMVGMFATGLTAAMIGLRHMGKVVGGIFGASATDVKQLGDNLDALSPKAREFALELQKLQPGFTQLRMDVQDTLFNNMKNSLDDFTTGTMPALRRGIAGTAIDLNKMGKGALDTVNHLSRMGTMDQMFGGLKVAMDPLVKVPGQFLNAWIKTSIAATPLLTRMDTAFGRWATNMSNKLNTAFDNGRLQAAISRAGDKVVQFFRNLANNENLREFIKRMEENGPRIAKIFSDIASAVLRIINAMAPITAVVLGIVDAFAKFIDAIPQVFLDALIAKFIIFKGALMISAMVKNLTKALIALRLTMAALSGNMDGVVTGLTRLGMQGPAVAATGKALGIFLRGAILIGGLMFTFRSINWVMDKIFGKQRQVSVDGLTTSLREFNQTGKVSGDMGKLFGASWTEKVDGLDSKFGHLQKSIQQVAHPTGWDRFFHGFDSATHWIGGTDTALSKYQKTLKQVDDVLSQMEKNGQGAEAKGLFEKLSKEANKAGTSTEKFKSLLPKYTQALKDSKVAQEVAATTMGAYGREAIKTQGFLDRNRQAVDGLRQSIEALNDVNRQAAGDEIGFHEAISNATDIIKANMKGVKDLSVGMDLNTKKGQENRRALLDLANSTSQFAQSTLGATGSYTKANAVYEAGRKQFIKLAQAAGATRTEAEKLANQWLKMPSKKVAFDADTQALDRKIKDAQGKIDHLKQKSKTAIGADKTELDRKLQEAQFKLDKLKGQKEVLKIQGDIDDLDTKIKKAQKYLDDLHQKRSVAVGANKKNFDDVISHAQAHLDALKQKKEAKLTALDATKTGVAAAQRNIDGLHGKTVHITTIYDIMKATGKSLHELISAKGGKVTAGGMRAYASGGIVDGLLKGPGTGTSDSLVARVSNGEYIMRAAAVKKYGTGFMRALNMERMPKFASGGQVGGGYAGGGSVNGGSLIQTIVVKASTTDAQNKISAVNKKLADMAKLAPKGVSIKATDNTKNATASARKNFASIPGAAQAAYNSVKGKTSTFGNQLVGQFNSLKGKNNSAWKAIASSLQNAISGAYAKVKASTTTFSNNTVSAITNIKNKSNAQWNAFGNSMQNKTKSMYQNMNNATTSFGNQNTAKFKSIVSSTGSAWGGLSGKFKPPISYLIHTVINKGVVGGMNAIISKLGGGHPVGGISVGGFATGGPIHGAGTKTSDSILARLSHGEFVMQASAVDKYGPGFMHAVNQGQLPGFAQGGGINIHMPAFAGGGSVPSADALNKMIGSGDSTGYRKVADWVLNNIVKPLVGAGPGGSAMKQVMAAGAQYLDKNMATFFEKHMIPAFMGGNIPSGQRLAIINAALRAAGVPPPGSMAQWQAGLNTLITRESGWNSNAINRTDSNAKAGHPSQGLAQTIPSTFNAYVPASLRSRGILDPVANVAAAIRYIVARYGNITNVQQANANRPPQGYRTGGHILGAGGPKSDSILARLSNGEFVMSADAVDRYGLNFMNAVNAGRLPGFASGGYTKTRGSGKNRQYYYHGKWYSYEGYKKAKSAYDKQQATAKAVATSEKDARGTLTGNVTFSHFGQMAYAQGSFQRNEIENELGRPQDISSLVNSLNSYASQIKGSFHGSTESNLLKQLDSSGKALLANQKKLDGVNSALEKATTNLDDLKGKFNQLKDSVTENIKSYGAITNIGKYGTSPTTLLNQLQTSATKATGFSNQLDQLKALGVDPELISQIAQAGVVEGGATANSILAMTPEQIKQLNAYQKQLTDAATKAGTTTAKAMYQSGIDAAQGLVDGLTKQKKAIEDTMMAIAKSMEAAIKKALGIKSPSRVMKKIAHFTADGLEETLVARTPGITEVMKKLVTPVSATIPATGTGTIANGSHGSCIHIDNVNINVDGTFNLSTPAERRKLAKTLVKDIKEEIRKDDKAHR